MFVILFTVGIVFNLIGFDWLTYLGIALVVLSGKFSSSQKNTLGSSVLVLVVAISAFASWHSWNASHNVRTPRHLDYWVFLTALWLLGLSWEGWRFWRMNHRSSSHDQPPNSTIQ